MILALRTRLLCRTPHAPMACAALLLQAGLRRATTSAANTHPTNSGRSSGGGPGRDEKSLSDGSGKCGAGTSAATSSATASSGAQANINGGRRATRQQQQQQLNANARKTKVYRNDLVKTIALPKRLSLMRSGGSGGASGVSNTTTTTTTPPSSAKHTRSTGGGGSGVPLAKRVALIERRQEKTVAAKRLSFRGGGASRTRGRHPLARVLRLKKKKPAAAPGMRRVVKRNVRKLRVCVLSSSYEGTNSPTASVDNFLCTPAHYISKSKRYIFENVDMHKINSYATVRKLFKSGRYDVFFNLCDGGQDEKRAGVDVVHALEEFNAAFTGPNSTSFEPSKIDMKLLVGSCGVRIPNFALLEKDYGVARKCRHLRFPVIVKPLSGYASVGISKDNCCNNLDELKRKVRVFIKEFSHALVEEFIRGREGTVLVCADDTSPHGIKVFRPLMFNFLDGADDFVYFDKKWTFEVTQDVYSFLQEDDPIYSAVQEMARHAFKYIMHNIGYGRVDFRVDERTKEPYFLEINPNCGMWYSEKDGGDFSDTMVQDDPVWTHEKFCVNAIARAMREQAARRPWYIISHNKNGQFSTRASKTVQAGTCLFGDATRPIPVVATALYKLGAEEPTVGCVITRGDSVHHSVVIRHSCEPNMHFVHGRTLTFAAKRQINRGEELTVDYATLRDENMPRFVCSCGTKNCRSVIFSVPPLPRTVELKALKKLLPGKKRQWRGNNKLDEDNADKIQKKRLPAAASTLRSTAGGGAHVGGK